jgi:hypothetical protein
MNDNTLAAIFIVTGGAISMLLALWQTTRWSELMERKAHEMVSRDERQADRHQSGR